MVKTKHQAHDTVANERYNVAFPLFCQDQQRW